MATIQSVLEFQDKMSAAISKISKTLDDASANATIAKSSLETLEQEQKEWKATLDTAIKSNSKNSENVKIAEQRYKEATQQVKTAKTELKKYEDEVQKCQSKIDAIAKAQNKFNHALDDSKGKFNFKELSIFGLTLGNVMGNFATRAIDGLRSAIGEAIQTASDLAEVQNVVDVAFGNSSKVIDEWAMNTLDKFGLNELSAKRYVGTMGAMLNSIGVTGDAMIEMSTKLTELSGDMASFYNLSNEEAFAKIRAGISGETEPLKRLGINLSEANLSAFAMAQGLNVAYNKMSESSKMIVRYQYLLSATKDAQGDFERTQGSFANQQKLLGENWKDLTAALANLFVPAMAKGMQVINGIMKTAMGFIDVIRMLIPALVGMAAVVITANIPAIIALGKQYAIIGIKAMAAGVKMAAAWLIGLGPIGWITAAVGAVIAIFTVLINKNAKVAESFWKIVNAIDTALTKFAQWRNRGNAEKVAELQAGLDKRIADRQVRVDNIKAGSTKTDKNVIGTGFEWKDLITTGGGGGKALKTQNQGDIGIKEEDMELLHDLATRDFMLNYQQLTPQITIPGMVIHEEADVNQVIDRFASAVTELVDTNLSLNEGSLAA